MFVGKQIIEADAGAYKDTLDTGNLFHTGKKLDLFRMIGAQILAGFRCKTLAVRTNAVL
jgi:hypothetical protein